ncbi:MAG: dihydrodipicolinate synthase family protein, partial [Halobacteriales archaeon]|nr:dihydrodipicolinate synthase family protein [Halobacteriales archaeon]
MSHEALKDNLRGVAAGLLTPFEEETLAVDHDALADNAQTLYEKGIRTYLAVANISEYHSLTHDERVASAETAAEALPDDASVLAGAGGSLREAIALATAYEEAGVDAI